MQMILASLSAALLLLTAAAHSLLGERRLIGPLTRGGQGLLASPYARFVLRAAWHVTSLSWIVLAVALVATTAFPGPATDYTLLATGTAFTAAGVIDVIGSKGRHIGWPLLLAIGLTALGAYAVGA